MQVPTPFPYPLQEYALTLAGRDWSVLTAFVPLDVHTEAAYLGEDTPAVPYGVVLWPAAIALAHELETRAAELSGRSVLELGAGTGLPGLVAAHLGARVVQTDRDPVALSLCAANAERNGIAGVERRRADWTDWHDAARYDFLLGSDVLYARMLHSPLRHIVETCLAPGGRALFADPLRRESLLFLEALERDGWAVSANRWDLSEGESRRTVCVYDLRAPSA